VACAPAAPLEDLFALASESMGEFSLEKVLDEGGGSWKQLICSKDPRRVGSITVTLALGSEPGSSAPLISARNQQWNLFAMDCLGEAGTRYDSELDLWLTETEQGYSLRGTGSLWYGKEICDISFDAALDASGTVTQWQGDACGVGPEDPTLRLPVPPLWPEAPDPGDGLP
jgi:hypothetical protein